MSARDEDSRKRRRREAPDDEAPAASDDDAIEIVEVVGVDETTGLADDEDDDAASGAGDPSLAGGDRRALARQLEEALREKDKYYDLLLRKQAEFDNFRKRADRERDEQRSGAAADLLRRILPVLDDFDRALAAAKPDDPLHRGFVLIQQQFLEILRKEGVQPIDSLGAPFDPHRHEAVEVVGVAGFDEGVILEEMRRGYTLHDKLLRPALVRVSSGRTSAASSGDKDGSKGGGSAR